MHIYLYIWRTRAKLKAFIIICLSKHCQGINLIRDQSKYKGKSQNGFHIYPPQSS